VAVSGQAPSPGPRWLGCVPGPRLPSLGDPQEGWGSGSTTSAPHTGCSWPRSGRLVPGVLVRSGSGSVCRRCGCRGAGSGEAGEVRCPALSRRGMEAGTSPRSCPGLRLAAAPRLLTAIPSASAAKAAAGEEPPPSPPHTASARPAPPRSTPCPPGWGARWCRWSELVQAFTAGLRERPVRLVQQTRGDHSSTSAVVKAAAELGTGTESPRVWVRQAAAGRAPPDRPLSENPPHERNGRRTGIPALQAAVPVRRGRGRGADGVRCLRTERRPLRLGRR
jgi:hypothetical protein